MRAKYFWVSTVSMVLAGVALFCGAGYAVEVSMGDFSADMVSSSGGEVVQAKFYSSGDKMRTEMAGSIVITRLDINKSYIIMPSERMYMEQPIQRQMLPKRSKELGSEVERLELGDDTVDGKHAKKFKVIYDEGSKREELYQWLTDSGFPIRMEAVDGSWSVEYKNLSMGSQPESLFEPPEGFEKLSMPFAGGAVAQSMDDIMAQAGADR